MKNQLAFIDEFGNNGLDFSTTGASTHFIVTAIIIDSNNLIQIEKETEAVRKKYFQAGEMKSKNIGDNDKRRKQILTALAEIEFYIFSVVIDKRELKTKGFTYKQSFYKFLHSLVDKELFRIYPDIKIVADEHGGDEFKRSFIQYIKANHVSDLFNQDFTLSDSKSNLLIQIADVITGTLSKCFESSKISQNRQDFLDILKNKILEIRAWPTEYNDYLYSPEEYVEFDKVISELSVNIAKDFILNNENSNTPATIDQVNCLKYLLFCFQKINPHKYIPTFEIINNIGAHKNSNVTMHYFRSKIIAKLRDKGVLIGSSFQGYKLPANNKDLFEFVNHTNSYVEPMLDRILKCRNLVKIATKNSVDIIDFDQFKYLQKMK
ncbi:MAG: DUF3800 domain-containing protein [Cytophaga sp.]|uniref:DUF3800 domain-containing protein n=1 Tax=Cytophaga sp. TaxID=29535 RepID=UPI003F7EA571